METDKIITESKLRTIIRNELALLLISEGALSNIDSKARYLKSKFHPAVAAIFLGASSVKPAAIAQSEMSDDEELMDFSNFLDQQQNKIESFGLTQQAAEKVVSSVLAGAKSAKEEELKSSVFKMSDEELQKHILDFQKEELAKLNDLETVKNIMIANFQKDIQQQGRSAIVKSSAKAGKIGAPSNIDSLLTGLGFEVQETLVATDDDSFVKLVPSKTKSDKNLKFNYMDLDSYWNGLVVDNSKLDSEIRKEADIIIPYHYYDTGGGAYMQDYIGSEIQKESKINKLKKRLNELRGLYV